MRYVSPFYNFNISSFVKIIILVNVFIWFFLVFVLQGLFLDKNYVFGFLGLTPEKAISHFWLWQIFTYFFIHAEGFFHIAFNMFVLWMFGVELERFWGSRFFLLYYMFCGIGAGVIYLVSSWIAVFLFNASPLVLTVPMVGASGAIFGILFAYGLIFSERTVYFMMVFPIKARYFTLLIAMAEFVSLVNSGMGSSVSHLAHLSGFLSGMIFLQARRLKHKFHFLEWAKVWKSPRLKVLKNKSPWREH